jgi:cytochrome c-type biogenesis protein CcmH
MNFAFFAAAIFMTIGAVGLVVTPLLREKFKAERRIAQWRLELKSLNGASAAGSLDPARYAVQRAALGEALLEYVSGEPKHAAPTMYIAFAIAILVPLAALGGYKWVGAAPAVQAQSGTSEIAMPLDHGAEMQNAIARLADKLRQNPDDAQGWALLGRTYKATQRYPEARDAFKHALEGAPGNSGLEREYAAAETPDDDKPMEVEQAQPQQCPMPGFDAAGDAVSTAPACNETSALANHLTPITVNVSLAANLKTKVLQGDTLFVFAKAAQGPPMPLAIARLTVAQLPVSVTLTDAMSMMPNLTLSKFSQIVLGARISKSGNAIAQPGDLQTLSATISNSQAEPIQLTIDRTVE